MNPYEVLGVASDAELPEIKKAYRKLARETHPDLNPGDAAAEARFKQISVAYDVLSDPERRKAYDEFGEIALESGFDAERARAEKSRFEQRFGSTDGTAFGGGFEFGDLDDLLRQFGAGGGDFRGEGGFGGGFSGRGGRGMRMPGGDTEATLELELADAVRGGERKMTVPRPRADGSSKSESITVRIPPGVTDGGRLRIPGKGGEGIGGAPAGDLWLNVRVRPHPIFRQQGRNLEFDLPLTVREAVLGTRVEVPTLDEPVTLTVPPGTSSHSRLRLRGKGAPETKGQPAGDLFARVRIVTPKQVDPEVREALERLEEPDPREGLWS